MKREDSINASEQKTTCCSASHNRNRIACKHLDSIPLKLNFYSPGIVLCDDCLDRAPELTENDLITVCPHCLGEKIKALIDVALNDADISMFIEIG